MPPRGHTKSIFLFSFTPRGVQRGGRMKTFHQRSNNFYVHELIFKPVSGVFLLPAFRREGNVFPGVCLFTGERGYPSARFFPRSLVPGPFWGGGTQSQVLFLVSGPRSFLMGVPKSQALYGIIPQSWQGVPQFQVGYPRTGVSPWLGLAYPPPDRTAQ